MSVKRLIAGAVVAQGLSLLGCFTANAAQILTYTGNDFAFANSPYTTSDKVTASVDLSTPLGDSVTNVTVAPTSFTITDGVQTLTQANSTISDFLFSTGPAGQITAWEIQVNSTGPSGDYIQTCSSSSCFGVSDLTFDFGIFAPTITTVTSLTCPSSIASMSGEGAGIVCSPGSWSSALTSAVPEPASLALLSAAFGLLAPMCRWKRRGRRA